MVSYFCELMGVSRSGYYNYFDEHSAQNRANQDVADEVVRTQKGSTPNQNDTSKSI